MWLSSLSNDQCHALLTAHNVIASDGLLDPNEEDMLFELKREMLSDVRSGVSELDGIQNVFQDRRSRIIVVINRAKLSYVDGALKSKKSVCLRRLREHSTSPIRTSCCLITGFAASRFEDEVTALFE